MIKLLLCFSVVATTVRANIKKCEEVIEPRGTINAVFKHKLNKEGYDWLDERFVGLVPRKHNCSDNPNWCFSAEVNQESNNYTTERFEPDTLCGIVVEKNPDLICRLSHDYAHVFPVQNNFCDLSDLEYMFNRIIRREDRRPVYLSNYNYIYTKIGLPFMKLYGNDNKYRGEIGLDVDRKKIVFFGSDKPFSSNPAEEFLSIRISNQKGQAIRDVEINGKDSMVGVMKKYNLGHSIPYEYDYIIEVTAKKTRTFSVGVDDIGGRKDSFEKVISNSLSFVLLDDDVVSYSWYKQNYLNLLLELQRNFDQWNQDLIRERNEIHISSTPEQKIKWIREKRRDLRTMTHQLNQDIAFIKGRETSRKMQIEIQNLGRKINKRFKKVERAIQIVQDRVEKLELKIENLSSKVGSISSKVESFISKVDELKAAEPEKILCSEIFGLASPMYALVPGAGTVASTVMGVVAATCTIAGV
ncbi:hypothetical protein QAD02_010120 [Eretmocerus hayati]|uniref:Uncharacterized protein n=1 Tax=Eretmocerus hayati TaxID=131215 RepID=A0ACC2NDS8_9HYME|nr:hypothetical protein QAD02_010120 [Eretmocerus hayati]